MAAAKFSFAAAVAAAVAIAVWIVASAVPPSPTPCGSPGGPPVTAPRVRLGDGRFLAYAEFGVPRERARSLFVFVHGFAGSRLDAPRASPELLEELGVYIVGFDRPGYGESSPDLRRSRQSIAFDIKELADKLNLGSKFYIMSNSLGGHATWAAIKYIPERLAGAVMFAPVVNYRWPGFPRELAAAAYRRQPLGDQWALRVSYYAPWLLHWWMQQSWLPTSTVIKSNAPFPNALDEEFRLTALSSGMLQKKMALATQQGTVGSFYADMKAMFGKWEFDPMELEPAPFPVHIWHGSEDGLVPIELQRHLCRNRLTWIHYNELPGAGHILSLVPGLADKALKALLAPASSEQEE